VPCFHVLYDTPISCQLHTEAGSPHVGSLSLCQRENFDGGFQTVLSLIHTNNSCLGHLLRLESLLGCRRSGRILQMLFSHMRFETSDSKTTQPPDWWTSIDLLWRTLRHQDRCPGQRSRKAFLRDELLKIGEHWLVDVDRCSICYTPPGFQSQGGRCICKPRCRSAKILRILNIEELERQDPERREGRNGISWLVLGFPGSCFNAHRFKRCLNFPSLVPLLVF